MNLSRGRRKSSQKQPRLYQYVHDKAADDNGHQATPTGEVAQGIGPAKNSSGRLSLPSIP